MWEKYQALSLLLYCTQKLGRGQEVMLFSELEQRSDIHVCVSYPHSHTGIGKVGQVWYPFPREHYVIGKGSKQKGYTLMCMIVTLH